MIPTATDPRVYFAAERTMVAWVRTGIAMVAFGFVVARFGLFLRLLQAQGGSAAGHRPAASQRFLLGVGWALVLAGIVLGLILLV